MLRISIESGVTGLWVPGHFIKLVSDATRDAERRSIKFQRAMVENGFSWRAFVRWEQYRHLLGI